MARYASGDLPDAGTGRRGLRGGSPGAVGQSVVELFDRCEHHGEYVLGDRGAEACRGPSRRCRTNAVKDARTFGRSVVVFGTSGTAVASPECVRQVAVGTAMDAAIEGLSPLPDSVILMDPACDRAAAMAFVAAAGRRHICAWVPLDALPVLRERVHVPVVRWASLELVPFRAPPRGPRIGAGLVNRLLAVLLLLVLAPVMAILALWAWLDDGRPVLFWQTRLGREGRPFQLVKFRSMREPGHGDSGMAPGTREASHGLLKVRGNPRVTRSGAWLRKFSLDELPQLLNIARGEMAFIGPRPLPAHDWRHATAAWHHIRLAVPPGLTGLWQVTGRNAVDFDDLCVLDAYYVHNRCARLQTWILGRTLPALWRGEGV